MVAVVIYCQLSLSSRVWDQMKWVQPWCKVRLSYCMESSLSRQIARSDWLPEQARQNYLAHLRLPTVLREKFPRKPNNKFFIDQAFFGQDSWIFACSLFASSWNSSVLVHKRAKNINIQLSWPHAWSITHISCSWLSRGETITTWSTHSENGYHRARPRKESFNCAIHLQGIKELRHYYIYILGHFCPTVLALLLKLLHSIEMHWWVVSTSSFKTYLCLQLDNSLLLMALVSFGIFSTLLTIAYHMQCIKIKNFKLYGIFVPQVVSFKTSSLSLQHFPPLLYVRHIW